MDAATKPVVDELLALNFDTKTIHRGWDYYQQGHVVSVEHAFDELDADESDKANEFIATVTGSRRRDYDVEFTIDRSGKDIDGYCSCPVEYQCKHLVAAALVAQDKYQALVQRVQPEPSKTKTVENGDALSQWLQQFNVDPKEEQVTSLNNSPATASAGKTAPKHELLYELQVNNQGDLQVKVIVCRLLQKGGYGKPQDFRFETYSHQAYKKPSDESIITDLLFLNRDQPSYQLRPGCWLSIRGRHSAECLIAMVKTGRCCFGQTHDSPLTLGEEQELSVHWLLNENASQQLHLMVGRDDKTKLILLDVLFYMNHESNQCGLVSSEVDPSLVQRLLAMPPVPPHLVEKTTEQLKHVLPQAIQTFPAILNKPITKLVPTPTPVMRLNIQQVRAQQREPSGYLRSMLIDAPVLTVSFDYDGYVVPFSGDYPTEQVTYAEKGTVYTFRRHFDAEKEALLSLESFFSVEPLSSNASGSDTINPDTFLITSLNNEDAYWDFAMTTLPQLEADGWRIYRDHEAFLEVLLEDDVEWYSELDDTSQYDYFGFKLGILINGEQVNMLPIIAEVFKQTTAAQLEDISEDATIPLPLPSGQVLSVPYARLKPMLSILVELFDTELDEQDGLQLSRRKAALLLEIQQALGAAKLRWFGGEKLRAFGEKLASFKQIQPVTVPGEFQANLREYQQEGVNWLQFLREYQMGGILADDMGLGKTVQTLAHLSIEKAQGRLTQPVLIIAPTSLMVNWRQEAAKFTPNLSILVFHGDTRHADVDKIATKDIILTTYPLLLRDKKLLLSHEFYYIILDEAQFIKNSKAKSTLIAQQLKAKHRLCLTGTPMENHLGELWSLFNFLMPGFLGDATQFKRLFRTPIEKLDNHERRKGLAMRVKPFLLRRQKQDVLLDLPEKTNIIRTVELQGAERDLYESVRLSMEKKVRDAIKKNGLSRSHIVILDAILKLRQICCHSRLLKLSAAKKAHKHSSKLAWLQESLPKMVEEGRRILLFSQFTSMLSIIEELLKSENISYVKLTGATKNRAKPIETFQSGKAVVFLISLKAGGTGLNLTAADTVIHYDPWWNPAVEDQATDRAHRMGQDKAVFVYKLIAQGTVEETIQEMQQKKRAIVSGLFSEKQSGKVDISSEDLSNLFKPLSSDRANAQLPG